MAFASAPGHGNLPNGVFSPVIYSKKVLKFFRKASVAEAITNTDYFGEIANFGDTVQIIKEPVLTVTPYQRGTTVTPQDLVDEDISLVVDKANSFSFKVDDIEVKQSHVNWEDLAGSSASYAIKDAYDTDILSYIRTEVASDGTNVYGTTGAPIDVGFGSSEVSPLAVMNRMNRMLDVQNVPTDNRWFVAGPLFWEQMQDEASKLMGVDFTGDSSSILRNGKVTASKIRGFDCYTSNNVPASGTTWYAAIGGHMSAVSTASQITNVERFRDHNSFADIVRGLHVYGRKVLRPKALALTYMQID